jgi:hypothetical protein
LFGVEPQALKVNGHYVEESPMILELDR